MKKKEEQTRANDGSEGKGHIANGEHQRYLEHEVLPTLATPTSQSTSEWDGSDRCHYTRGRSQRHDL
jgi:hypothetical protein